MKELTKREAMEILLAGGKVDYYFKDGEKGVCGPFSWCENLGVVDKDGETSDLDWSKLTEHKEPKKIEYWVNIYANGVIGRGRLTKEEADKAGDETRLACIKISCTEGDGL